MATEKVNESPKDALERRQAEEVKAWIEWDNVQKAAEAQIAALTAQPASTDVAIKAAQQAAVDENQKKIDDPTTGALAKKAAIEYAWLHELKCPLRQLTADIDKAVKKERAERLVEATNRPPEAGNGTREQVQDLKAETLMHAAQVLLDHNLLPQALRSGPDQKMAAGLVRPDLAAELPSAAASAELSEYADQIQPIYDRQALYAEAAKDMEKGVVVGKAGETLKEAISNPSRLGAGVAALVGLGLLYSVFKDDVSPNAGLKKWVMGILGVGAVAAGGYGALKGLDVFNTATGIRTDALLSSDSMKTVRAELEAKMGTKESGVIDDMMRVFDSPIENYAEAYLSALGHHSNGIEKEKLLGGKGLTSKEAEYANNKFLKQGGDWLFMKCYDMALKDGKTSILNDADAKRAAGAHYAQTEFAGLKVGSILVAIDMVEAGVGLAPSVSETRVTDPHLHELETKDDAFAKVLEPTDKPDVYLINGYPVRYTYTDGHDHVFTSLLPSGPSFSKVAKALDGQGLTSTLLRIAEEAKAEALTEYAKAASLSHTPAAPAPLKYNNRGDWVLDPAQNRATHAGLAGYLTGANDPKVPVILYFDTASNTIKIGMDKDGDGVPEKRTTPYRTIADVAEEFEKGILHDRVVMDTSSTLLMPFTVDKVQDVAADTEVLITYGGGAKGKIIYTANKIASYTLDAPVDADLSAKWTAKATDVCKLKVLGDPRVQAALLRGTTSYTGYNPGKIAGLVSKFIGLAKDGVDWFGNDSIQEAFEDDWEKQIVKKMTDLLYDPVNGLSAKYVTDVFKTFSSNANFQGVEDTFINAQVTSIAGTGVVTAMVSPEVLPDSPLQGTQLTKMLGDARDALEVALDPLHYEKSSASGSMSWSLVNGVWNFVTQDTGRSKLFNDQVDVYMRELATACNPVPATPGAALPAALTRQQVKDQIDIAVRKAQIEATGYWGLSDADATRKLMLVPLGPSPDPEWKKSTEMVADYLANHFKWESYGVFPNPENMAAIMSVWYEKMGDPTIAPANAADAKAFADYFLWDVWVTFGGNKDYSMDKLYGGAEIDTVSDSDFRAGIAGFKTNLDAYASWTHRPANNKLRPPVPGMESDLEKYKPVVQKQMEDWFATQNDIKIWSRFYRYGPDMFKWKEVYERSFARRMNDIITTSTDVNVLRADLEDFKKFVGIEQHMVYEPLIMAGMVPESGRLGLSMPWSVFVETEINKDYTKYFNAVPRDFDGYKGYIKKNMGDALDVYYHRPNVPGIPFWG